MKRIMLKLLLPLLAAASVLTCSLPPYDEGLSLGLETARRMVEVGAEQVEVGPVEVFDGDLRDWDFHFMPCKSDIPDPNIFKSGFVIGKRERSLEIAFIEYFMGPPEDFFYHRGWGAGLPAEDPDGLNYFAETVKNTGPLTASPTALQNLAIFDAGDYEKNHFLTNMWPPGPQWFIDPPVDPDLPNLRNFIYWNFFGGIPDKWPIVVGTSISAEPGPDDRQVFFCKFDGNGDFAEVHLFTNTGQGIDVGIPGIWRDDLDFNFPDDVENGFYHYDWPSDISYFSYYSKTQRKYKNYKWGPGGPGAVLTPLIKMNRRIDAVLSNGNLLSFENNRCYVYDSDGEKQYDFLLGGLHYCYEVYLGGIPHVVFSLGGMLSINDWDNAELYFSVFILETNLLDQLQ